MDGGAWKAAVHGVAEGRTRLSDFTFTFHFHALEKEMVTHSSVLAWRIPGTGEPGGLPSMELHKVRHNWSDLAAAAAVPYTINEFKRDAFKLGEVDSRFDSSITNTVIESISCPNVPQGCPGDSGKESACHCQWHKRHGFDPRAGKILWRRKWQPTPVFLPGNFHGQSSLVGYSPWGRKEWDMTEHTCTHTHSPITILCSDWTVSRTGLTRQKCPWSGQGALLHSWLYPSWSLRAIQTGAHVTPPFVIAPTEFKTNDYKRWASIWHFISAQCFILIFIGHFGKELSKVPWYHYP